MIRFDTKILKYWSIGTQKYWTTESSPKYGSSCESISCSLLPTLYKENIIVIRLDTKILKHWNTKWQKYWTTESSPMHGTSWKSISPGNTLLQMQLYHWNTKVALNHWKFSKQCMVPKCISRCPTTFHYCNVWESISCRLLPKYEYIRKALQLKCFKSAYKIPRDNKYFLKY